MQLNCNKLHSFYEACSIRQTFKQQNKKVILTNGCFDLLHVGHIYSLQQASEFGDSLWIALNSDSSIKSLKDTSRPIINENQRAYMLSALECVAGIFIFDTKRLDQQILKFHPDVYVKSNDYTIETLDKLELSALKTIEADVKFLEFLDGFSTTSLISKIKNL